MHREVKMDGMEIPVYSLWADQWLLLACGDFAKNHYNAMTIAWGSLGCMWHKPFVQVVVRPGRYTHEFMEQYDTFTVSAFPPELKPALNIMGTRSGRDTNKMEASGLTAKASKYIKSPSFEEASLIFECKKMYKDHLKVDGFLDPSIDKNYPQKDYHSVYFGEIVAVLKNE